MADANRKLLALKFAHQILTDSRNSDRYCFSRLRNSAGDIVDYFQMLDLLNELAADLKGMECRNMSNQQPTTTAQEIHTNDNPRNGAQTPDPCNPPPMPKVQPAKSQEVLRMLKPGDKVVKNNRYYVPEGEKGREYVVSSEPRMLCDTLVVEISCGTRRDPAYSVDGLDLVESGGAE